MFLFRPLSSLLAGSRSLAAARPLLPQPMAAARSAAAASSPTHQIRSVAWLPHGKNKSKSTRYQTMLKAKRRRQRRGKTGGPRRDVKSFSTFVGFRKEITFIPRKLGFNQSMLKDDPSLVVPIEAPVIAPEPTATSATTITPIAAPSSSTSS